MVIDDENADGFTASYGRLLSTVRRFGHEVSMSSQVATPLPPGWQAHDGTPGGPVRGNQAN